MQMLPILLLGGGAAYMVKKQRDKRKGVNCPPENTVTLQEDSAAAQQAVAKYGNAADPFKEADYYIRTLLPEECNKNSVKSRVRMNFPYMGKSLSVDLSVADLYMLGVMGGIDRRIGMKKISQEQGQKFMLKALEWYKKKMGKPFDPSALGLEKLAQAMLESMKHALEEGGSVPGSNCPDHVVVNLNDAKKSQISSTIKMMIDYGEKDPFHITNRIFGDLMPVMCKKGDFQTTVEARHNGQLYKTYNATSFYVAIALDVMEDLIEQGVMTQQTAVQVYNDLKANYKHLTGEEIPPNLN